MPGTAVALHSVKDLPISMIGAQVQEVPWSVYYSVDDGYVAQPNCGGCGR